MTAYHFLQPLDVLYLRGNKLFGAPGSYGESLVPPWPSVAAGALRSRILADERIDLAEFAAGRRPHPTLGTPAQPGAFTITAFHLAGRTPDGAIEGWFAPPADLVLTSPNGGTLRIARLTPQPTAAGIASSSPLAKLPILADATRCKPVSGQWLTQAGWGRYLAGEPLSAEHCQASGGLWQLDARVGVGLDAERSRADDGKLFTAQAVALRPDIGFLVGLASAETAIGGTLRFGGDGRAVAIQAVDYRACEPDYGAIAHACRCRLVLTTPGLFPDGWLPPGARADGHWALGEVRGQLVCAAVPRAEVVSGWDLAQWQPKPAQRVAAAGSVYWIEDLQATPEALRKLANAGLWRETEDNPQRRAEGFNRFTFAAY